MTDIQREDLIYIAGFFDGEGSIGVYKSKVYQPTGSFVYTPRFGISNTNKLILNWIYTVVGFGCIRQQTRYFKQSCKDCYCWDLRIEEMKEFLPKFLPFVKVKKLQVELVIEFFTYNNENDHDLIRREIIHDELKGLNKRGK